MDQLSEAIQHDQVTENVELVKQAYQDFGAGDIPAVVARFDPNIEWHECQGLPYAPDGIYRGPESVVNDVLAKLPDNFEKFQIDIVDLFGGEDKVVMVGYYRGIWKETGKEFKANATHTWTIKDGRATRFFQAVDTAEIINP